MPWGELGVEAASLLQESLNTAKTSHKQDGSKGQTFILSVLGAGSLWSRCGAELELTGHNRLRWSSQRDGAILVHLL